MWLGLSYIWMHAILTKLSISTQKHFPRQTIYLCRLSCWVVLTSLRQRELLARKNFLVGPFTKRMAKRMLVYTKVTEQRSCGNAHKLSRVKSRGSEKYEITLRIVFSCVYTDSHCGILKLFIFDYSNLECTRCYLENVSFSIS